MYDAHWNLQRKPFDAGCEPDFYYPAESHQSALLKLRYAIENRQGAAVLVSESGLGKTLLTRTLLNQLCETTTPQIELVFPRMPAKDLLAWICAELTDNMSIPDTSAERVRQIQQALTANAEVGNHAVWVIDEAHLLSHPASLETLRLLMNFQSAGRPDWTIILSGQMPLLGHLERHPALDERMVVKCQLQRFTPEETAGYIAHRLRVAGTESPIFDDEAIEAIHGYSQGIPRRIHRLCDLGLLLGFAEDLASIGEAEVETVARELGWQQTAQTGI